MDDDFIIKWAIKNRDDIGKFSENTIAGDTLLDKLASSALQHSIKNEMPEALKTIIMTVGLEMALYRAYQLGLESHPVVLEVEQ